MRWPLPRPFAPTAAWTGGVWPKTSRNCAVPLTRLQIDVLQLLAAQRSPDSDVAGGAALNHDGPRFSNDIDIFQDSQERLDYAADADADSLIRAGFELSWVGRQRAGKRTARVHGPEESILLEWVTDSDFRFFPSQPDKLFGYVLHPVDLAANKASAAADRREPRDILDLITIHHRILPLGAVITAAVGRFPGLTPEEMLGEITRHSRFTAEEFRALSTEQPLDSSEVHRNVRAMLEDAEAFINQIPTDLVGVVFLDANGIPVPRPDPSQLTSYQLLNGSRRGLWPTSPAIDKAMLESYDRRGGETPSDS